MKLTVCSLWSTFFSRLAYPVTKSVHIRLNASAKFDNMKWLVHSCRCSIPSLASSNQQNSNYGVYKHYGTKHLNVNSRNEWDITRAFIVIFVRSNIILCGEGKSLSIGRKQLFAVIWVMMCKVFFTFIVTYIPACCSYRCNAFLKARIQWLLYIRYWDAKCKLHLLCQASRSRVETHRPHEQPELW